MRLFIVPEVNLLTESYHADGALVVVAEDLAAAQAHMEDVRSQDEAHKIATRQYAWQEKEGRPIVTDAEWATAITFDLAGDVSPRHFLFPNAGCC